MSGPSPGLTRRLGWPTALVLALTMPACDRFEDYKLEASGVSGKALIARFDDVRRDREMICENLSRQRLDALSSLAPPTVVVCRDWSENVDVRAEFGEQGATLHIDAVSGKPFGTPPGKKAASELQHAFEEAGATVKVVTISP